jgi:outer membrane receptor protein involved in Fe transport
VSLALGLFALAAPAQAQDAPPPADQAETAPSQPDPTCANMPVGSARDACISGEVELESGEAATAQEGTIVVTGSRIRQPNLESAVPITSIGQQELTSTGDVNVGDRLNDLPALRSTFSQANSTRFIGTAGVNVLDLRGLGTTRTLVLVNGRRHITYSPGDFLVDVNTIPTDLIERVDVVTGGNSAVYGSDAVAGVVNFILKRDFEGLRIKGQAGISSRGDRGVQFVTGTYGKNFFDDRANIAVNLEYVDADPLYFHQRPGLTGSNDGRCQFNLAEPTGGEPAAGDGVPDNQFFCGVRNASISNGGTIAAGNPQALVDVTGNGVLNANDVLACNDPRVADPAFVNPLIAAQRCLNPGSPTTGAVRFLNFGPDGTACEEIPAFDFRPFGSGNYIHNPNSTCAPGATLRDTGQLAPGLKRYTANLLAHFDVSDAFKPFIEAKFVRLDALQEGQPSFFQSSFPAFFGLGRGIRCDNPFLTAQNITALQTIGRCAGGATSTETIPLGRFNVDFGGRQEKIRRDTYRLVGGVTGDFNDDWNYEVSVNYGHMKSRQREFADLHIFNIDEDGNFLGEGPFLNAIDAVRDSSGNIVCRINADADPDNNDPACVPLNVLGFGQPSQAALDYVNTVSQVNSNASELDILAYINGDSSQVFELPGGPVRFSIGGEYRRERAFQDADTLSASGGTFFNAFSTFDPPTFSVKEAFGEIQLPLLRNVPFAEELTLSGAARYSDYNTSANHTFAWNANGIWAPTRDIKFRANYSKSVRVPTLGDLFSPASQNFGFVSDPCDVLFINNAPNRVANCAALGIPVGFVNTPARTQTIGFLSGGNPELEEETGKSLTLGAVFTPRWVPGFSFTVDYYRIKVTNLIAVLSAQQIINSCVDLPSIDNQYCPQITRNPDFTFADPALLSAGRNFAKLEANGIDFEASFRRNWGQHRLNLRGVATYVLKRNNFIDPTQPDFSDRSLSELGDPRWAANATIGYGYGPVNLTYSLNYIGPQTIGTYESQHSFDGNPPQNADAFQEVNYPDVPYHALRVDFEVPSKSSRKMNLYLGVDNLFDTKPPFGLLGNEGGVAYDAIGRYFYAGATVDFSGRPANLAAVPPGTPLLVRKSSGWRV